MSAPLDIVYTVRFDKELAELLPDAKRADEFVRGAEWAVARNPEIGRLVCRSTPVWHLPMAEVRGLSPVALYYTYHEDRVYLLSIRATSEATGGDEE